GPEIGAAHRVLARGHGAWALQMAVPDQLSHAQCATGIARGGLDPEPLERTLSEQAPVRDTVERHAPGETQVLEPRLPMRRPRHAHHDLLAHDLDRAREIHLPLGELRFRYARRTPQQRVERAVGHRETGEVIEVLLVERERAVLAQVDELAVDDIDIL